MVGKRGRKPGVRNKFKQVLLVEGWPSILYSDDVRTLTSLSIDDEHYNLGQISFKLSKHLEKIPGCIVKTRTKNIPRTVGLVGFSGLHIRKAGENTTIEVSAPTEQELMDKISKIRNGLEKEGEKITERCSWVCTVDKGHPVPPVKQSSKTTSAPNFTKKNKKIAENMVKNCQTDQAGSAPSRMSERTKKLREMAIRMGVGDETRAPGYQKVKEVMK